MATTTHQYVDRRSGRVCTERFLGDRVVSFIYSDVRENAPTVFKALTSARASSMLGYLNFDSFLKTKFRSPRELIRSWGVDVSECLDELEDLNTPTKLFTRKIRYWECRPMNQDPWAVVSPADSRVLIGSLKTNSLLFIKHKFFDFEELLGTGRERWHEAFQGGEYAIFRLTPDKYHYNHNPVAGRIEDIYETDGEYHSCNPEAVLTLAGPYSKNKRVVTIFNTDVVGGTGAGYVAMIEVAALMVGDIEQCYSLEEYKYPKPVKPGMFLEKGRPKSLFKPGSSTVILLFQPDRILWEDDLLDNQSLTGVQSRFTSFLGRPTVETDLQVRSQIGTAKGKANA